ncbi:MAG: hypothetical protein ACK4XJ_08135 [Fimbriimonadaceae bacterium]
MKGAIGGLLFLGAAIACGVLLSLKPWQVYAHERAKTNQMVSEMRDIEQRRAELLSQKARMESPTGREELAREAGYRRADEKPLTLREASR